LDAALPLNLLNEVPDPTRLKDYPAELGQFVAGQVTPFAKVPTELLANRSFFFRKDIQSDAYPRVSAPAWVKRLPKPAQDMLGVKTIVDRRSGKPVTGWYGRSDYLAKSFPGLPVLLQQLTTEGSLRSGRTGADKWLSATGVKVDPIDPKSVKLFDLLKKSHEVQVKINGQQQTPGGMGGKKSQSPETRRLYAERQKIDEQIYRLSRERGDVKPYKEGQLSKASRARALGGSSVPGVRAPSGTLSTEELQQSLGGASVGSTLSTDELKRALGR
jgi:hypothetical protein